MYFKLRFGSQPQVISPCLCKYSQIQNFWGQLLGKRNILVGMHAFFWETGKQGMEPAGLCSWRSWPGADSECEWRSGSWGTRSCCVTRVKLRAPHCISGRGSAQLQSKTTASPGKPALCSPQGIWHLPPQTLPIVTLGAGAERARSWEECMGQSPSFLESHSTPCPASPNSPPCPGIPLCNQQ